jgi:hypothetical protein
MKILSRKIKNLLALVFVVFMGHEGTADIITLNSLRKMEGKVTKIKHCMITLKTDTGKYQIPAEDIYSIQFEDEQDKVYRKYLSELKVDPSKCVNGRLDAVNHHGKKSGHIAMGFLLGPFAMLGTALSEPTPEKGQTTVELSEHPELLQDPDYVSCYKKKAKGRLIGAESIGFGIAVLMIALITPTYLASQ